MTPHTEDSRNGRRRLSEIVEAVVPFAVDERSPKVEAQQEPAADTTPALATRTGVNAGRRKQEQAPASWRRTCNRGPLLHLHCTGREVTETTDGGKDSFATRKTGDDATNKGQCDPVDGDRSQPCPRQLGRAARAERHSAHAFVGGKDAALDERSYACESHPCEADTGPVPGVGSIFRRYSAEMGGTAALRNDRDCTYTIAAVSVAKLFERALSDLCSQRDSKSGGVRA